MFSGIIETLGILDTITPTSGGMRVTIKVKNFLEYTSIGDSISVNGVCLTVVWLSDDAFGVDISKETTQLTTFGYCKKGEKMNLEHALSLSKVINGHLVSGHIDTLGEVTLIEKRGDNAHVQIKITDEFDKYIVKKGSISVNGVSLTINEIVQNIFALNIIPHTLKSTNLQNLAENDKVNIEIDIIARHLEKLLKNK